MQVVKLPLDLKVLRTISGDPWYVNNSKMHKEPQIPTARNEVANLLDKVKSMEHPDWKLVG